MKQEETLAEFLLARIAEDEAKLRGLDGTDWSGWHADRCYYEGGYEGTHACDCGAVDRRLAECEAKRRIIDLHKPEDRSGGWGTSPEWRCTVCGGRTWHPNLGWQPWSEFFPCPTLRFLALPYADHPDYQQEWKP